MNIKKYIYKIKNVFVGIGREIKSCFIELGCRCYFLHRKPIQIFGKLGKNKYGNTAKKHKFGWENDKICIFDRVIFAFISNLAVKDQTVARFKLKFDICEM